jgi:flagella basal body P-ring formation protein FlgA
MRTGIMTRHSHRFVRFARVVALVALCAPFAPAPAGASTIDSHAVPALKHSAVVTDEIVRIGDLIENAGSLAAVPIFRAPDVGTTGSVSTQDILDAVRPYHLFRLDVADITAVEVTRAGRSITPSEIKAHILRAFAGHHGLGEAPQLTLEIDRDIRSFTVEANITGELQVVQSSFEPRTGRFDITLELPGSAIARRRPLHFTGSIVERVEVVVLARSLQRGDIIRRSDLAIEHRRKNETPIDAVGSADNATRLAVRMNLRAGQLLRQSDLMKPELVKRNETVSLIYEAPGILLTTRGKATESGAEGDLITAINLQSKRTVQGIVTGPGQIKLIATTSRLITASISNDRPFPAQNTSGRGE